MELKSIGMMINDYMVIIWLWWWLMMANNNLIGGFNLPSGYVKLVIENDHRNSGFSHDFPMKHGDFQ